MGSVDFAHGSGEGDDGGIGFDTWKEEQRLKVTSESSDNSGKALYFGGVRVEYSGAKGWFLHLHGALVCTYRRIFLTSMDASIRGSCTCGFQILLELFICLFSVNSLSLCNAKYSKEPITTLLIQIEPLLKSGNFSVLWLTFTSIKYFLRCGLYVPL